MAVINSLYEFIKQKSKEKGRPLKIICDWDETLQPVNPFFFYKLAKKKGWKLPQEPFKNWFDYYWNNSIIEYRENQKGRKIPYTIFVGIEKIEEIRNKDPDWWGREGIFNEMVRKPAYEIMDEPNFFYEESPFLSTAEELLMALKEDDLINRLIIVTASNGGPSSRKRKKFNKTFANFSKVELVAEEIGRYSKRGKYRWQWIKENHPDFDIFIDDNPEVIKQAQEKLPADKAFLVPNYKSKNNFIMNQGKNNICFFKTIASDLKDEEFEKAALELKLKKIKARERERERERRISQLRSEIQQLEQIANRTAEQEAELASKKQELADLEKQQLQDPNKTNWTPWIIGGVILVLVIGIIAYFWGRNKEK